jgi:Domain of unknown function (DUF2703)
MRIEILYIEGCPYRHSAVAQVQQVLREEDISAELLEASVSQESAARELRFLGSPTIRVNGLDVEPTARASREYGVMCRTYVVNGRRVGLPSREMLRQAICEARSGSSTEGASMRVVG